MYLSEEGSIHRSADVLSAARGCSVAAPAVSAPTTDRLRQYCCKRWQGDSGFRRRSEFF